MKAKRREPVQLKRGREHDHQEKESWRRDGMDVVFADRPGLEKYSTGRIGTGNDGLIVEIKSDDLDRLSAAALRRRLAKYVRQIEDYTYSPSLDFDTMHAAIQFRRRPVTPGRAEFVERTFNDPRHQLRLARLVTSAGDAVGPAGTRTAGGSSRSRSGPAP